MPSFNAAVAALATGLLALAPTASPAAWELGGTKAIFAVTADGARVKLGSVEFKPASDGATGFEIKMEPAPFSDHFLSMREFKCVQGATELTCHVPYPYANPRTVKAGDLTWLEHSLLFFYKRPADFGAKLWNGIYFELRATDAGLVGQPKAVDLNLIAAPPADPATPPYRPALRDDMPTDARWIRSLSIE